MTAPSDHTSAAYKARHARRKDDDERHAEARAAGLCGACEGTLRDVSYGWPCDGCRGLGTAQAQTDVTLDSILADLAALDA